jgi:uncharacterized protein YigE (DUF2233 family)
MKLIIIFLLIPLFSFQPINDIIYYEAQPSSITMLWKNKLDLRYKTFGTLFVNNPNLVFATNGGMFGTDQASSPLGLYIENGSKLKPLRKVNNPKYNFGMQPQGIFLITKDNVAKVITVGEYEKLKESDVKYANQSAPMLIINKNINPKLTKSSSYNIRNGVGILPNGNVLFIISKEPVTFQQFAKLFLERGCTSAMYLDGGISNGLTRELRAFDGCECYGPFIGVNK